jgi:hypothetical protein
MGKRQRRRLRQQSQAVVPYGPSRIDPKRVAENEATTRLRRLVQQRTVIEREIDAEVDRLECWGFSWYAIGQALGVTRQAARQRHVRRHSAWERG